MVHPSKTNIHVICIPERYPSGANDVHVGDLERLRFHEMASTEESFVRVPHHGRLGSPPGISINYIINKSEISFGYPWPNRPNFSFLESLSHFFSRFMERNSCVVCFELFQRMVVKFASG